MRDPSNRNGGPPKCERRRDELMLRKSSIPRQVAGQVAGSRPVGGPLVAVPFYQSAPSQQCALREIFYLAEIGGISIWQ